MYGGHEGRMTLRGHPWPAVGGQSKRAPERDPYSMYLVLCVQQRLDIPMAFFTAIRRS